MTLKTGDAIRASDGGKPEPRPGVVLRVHTIDGVEWAFIGFGSTKGPKPPPPTVRSVLVKRGDTGYLELRLDQPTYFKSTHGGRIRTDDEDVIVYGPCPDSLFVAIKDVFGLK